MSLVVAVPRVPPEQAAIKEENKHSEKNALTVGTTWF
jgi:hypothetical protein